MRKLLLPILLLFSACQSPKTDTLTVEHVTIIDSVADRSTPAPPKDSTWIDGLRTFRQALYQHDIAGAARFVDFPILNPQNNIWFLAYGFDEKATAALPATTKPFTRADFATYFNKIFPPDFTTALLKLKTDTLYQTGYAQSPELRKNKTTTYRLTAELDKETQILRLNLHTNIIEIEPNGDVIDGGESTIIYEFKIIGGKDIRFVQLMLAG